MTRTIRARFSKGVFEPLEPTVGELINEGEEVMLTIETRAATPSGDPVQDTAGGWRGLIDAETFKEAIYHDRLIATRPPAKM
jgi:predicted DNA-binding antitoxin AbrB/MazE fold protein